VLIESNSKKIITDPFFGTWGNPAYARRSQPALKREDLTERIWFLFRTITSIISTGRFFEGWIGRFPFAHRG
jgi:hypothetical protein